MPKFFVGSILVAVVFSLIIIPAFAQTTSNSIEINTFTPPSPSPALPNIPDLLITTPTSPNVIPTSTGAPTSGQDSCPDLVDRVIVAFQRSGISTPITEGNEKILLETSPDVYGLIFVKPSYIAIKKEEVLKKLKQSNSPNLEQKAAQDKIIDSILDSLNLTYQTNGSAFRSETPDPNIQTLKNLTQEIRGDSSDPVKFYQSLYVILNSEATKSQLFKLTYHTVKALNENSFPKLPYLIYNQRIAYTVGNADLSSTAIYDGYPHATNWRDGLLRLGCSSVNPQALLSITPLIHIYSQSGIKVSIKLKNPQNLTYANHLYSKEQGFSTQNQESTIYYELIKDSKTLEKLVNSAKKEKVIVSLNNLKDYLLNTLLPTLSLTQQEIEQFIEKEVNPQLNNLDINSSSRSFQVIHFSNKEVETLIPQDITPSPNILQRNLIVIVPTTESETNNQSKPQPRSTTITRDGLVVIENGFVILN